MHMERGLTVFLPFELEVQYVFSISYLLASILITLYTVTYIDYKGRRVTTESGYLTPDVLGRSNLTIVTHASVTKLLLHPLGGRHRVSAAEVASNETLMRLQIKARNEVILSSVSISGIYKYLLITNCTCFFQSGIDTYSSGVCCLWSMPYLRLISSSSRF